ncbi:thioredoxin-disulfide reductase [Candidatus Avelusimicrobium luingense]|uniref:thioredoxin-disulfide reductase n=1 Tax=Candidatus Avelusimicrobium luingense TaxID=3416211 RepID=UPI003D0BC827
MTEQTDLLIIGAGPAGCSAAIYAVRAGLKTVIAGGSVPGGQLLQTNEIENYAGFVNPVGGFEIMDTMHKQCKRLGVEFTLEEVAKIEGEKTPFTVTCTSGKVYQTASIVIATGAKARWLNLPEEEHLRGKGVSACATCDGFFMRGKNVCVVGGGNTAFEDALFLAQFCPKVYLVHRREGFRADQVTVEQARNNPKIEFVLNVVPEKILGDDIVTGLRVKNVQTGQTKDLDVSGVFVAIGAVPQTAFLKDSLVALSDSGLVLADERTHTTIEGIFAAGDCADKYYRQAIIAAGSGAKAGIEAAAFVNKHR